MKKRTKTYTISAVAELYDIHPQTLRLYEREGLLTPSRSVGNTRLYEDSDLERLEIILSLTRELGVNLAGVEIILNMREKMAQMQREFEQFFEYLKTHANEFSRHSEAFTSSEALIPVSRIKMRHRAEVMTSDEQEIVDRSLRIERS
jgi:MerR family transcriptional regulator, heat shock protein HspR